MRIAVCGHGRHGKGTAATYLSQRAGLRYNQSTSEAAAQLVFKKLSSKYGFSTVQECWDSRHLHRDEWAEIIWTHNKPEGTTLYEDMCAENDIIEGIRDASELRACQEAGIIQLSLWIDASLRKPPEASSSCTVEPDDCDVIIDNNKDKRHLTRQIDDLCTTLFA